MSTGLVGNTGGRPERLRPSASSGCETAYAGLVETRRDGLWVHYRLGRLADPVLSAVVDAVRHALAHDAAVQRDAERLQKRTGCCVPTPGDVAGSPCCSDRAEFAGAAR